jgi:hypothetical protein
VRRLVSVLAAQYRRRLRGRKQKEGRDLVLGWYLLDDGYSVFSSIR